MKKYTPAMLLILLILLLVSVYLWTANSTRCDATTYAAGFTEAKFKRVRHGMTKAEVLDILGKPLRDDHENSESWDYPNNRWDYTLFDRSKIPHDDPTNTWAETRAIIFDKPGRVKTILISTDQFE